LDIPFENWTSGLRTDNVDQHCDRTHQVTSTDTPKRTQQVSSAPAGASESSHHGNARAFGKRLDARTFGKRLDARTFG